MNACTHVLLRAVHVLQLWVQLLPTTQQRAKHTHLHKKNVHYTLLETIIIRKTLEQQVVVHV